MKKLSDSSKINIICVIPVFNAEKTICRAVVSALRQKTVKIQVLVVDHGSSDGTADLLNDRFTDDSRLSLIRIKRRRCEIKSASRPLNVGFSEALRTNSTSETRTWLFRLDADDFLSSDDILQKFLIKGEYAPLISGYITFFDTCNRTAIIYGPDKNHQTRNTLLYGGAYGAAHHATLMRSDLLQDLFLGRKFYYDENISYGEDLDMTMHLLRIVDKDNFRFVPASVMFKFFGNGTISNTTKRIKIFNDMRVIFSRFPELPRNLLGKLALDLILRNGGTYLEALRVKWGSPAGRVAFTQSVDYKIVQNRINELDQILLRLQEN